MLFGEVMPSGQGAVVAQTVNYIIPGTFVFEVPSFNSIRVRVWGPGGGGGGRGNNGDGGAGPDSTFGEWIICKGGEGGKKGGLVGAGGQGGNALGQATGGDLNTTGPAGTSVVTFGAGGAGGVQTGEGADTNTGRGGQGDVGNNGPNEYAGGGGQSGAYARKDFTPSMLTVGQRITLVVGAGGTSPGGQAGFAGKVQIIIS